MGGADTPSKETACCSSNHRTVAISPLDSRRRFVSTRTLFLLGGKSSGGVTCRRTHGGALYDKKKTPRLTCCTRTTSVYTTTLLVDYPTTSTIECTKSENEIHLWRSVHSVSTPRYGAPVFITSSRLLFVDTSVHLFERTTCFCFCFFQTSGDFVEQLNRREFSEEMNSDMPSSAFNRVVSLEDISSSS